MTRHVVHLKIQMQCYSEVPYFSQRFLGVIILIPVLQVDQLYRMIDCITQILVQKFKVEQVTKFFSNKCYNYLDAVCV